MDARYEALFQPMQVGGVTVKNRVVLCAMENTSPIESMLGYKFNKHCVEYYRERAKNEVGLFIPGLTTVKSMMGGKWLHEQEALFTGPLKELMDEIHGHGSKLFMQLGAGFGRVQVMPQKLAKVFDNKLLAGAAGLFGIKEKDLLVAPHDGLPNVWMPERECRGLTREEIAQFVEAFAKSALLCKQAGVDGIEIHAIHEGYLLDQFAIASTNHRTDEYGGSLENRFRFVADIIKAIKKACGEEYPVIVRYSVASKMRGLNAGALPGEEYEEFGRSLEESPAAAKLLQEAGCDALDADNGSYDSWYWAHPPVYMPLACNLPEAAFIKQHVDIPVFCAGRMEDPATAAEAVASGKIDAVGIARQFLADAEWCTKVKNGNVEDIRPCIACHNGCFALSSYKGEPVSMPHNPMAHCALNPATLNEAKYAIKPAAVKKKVAVVGGGIGGMEVARIAALRGHEVTLYEKSGELGGVFIAAAAPDFKEKDKMLIAWYKRQVAKLPIEVKLNTAVSDIATLGADEVVIATGAKPRALRVQGVDGKNVMEACDYLLDKKPVGERVAVIGGGLTGCEIAYDLALKGKKPFIIEMQDDILKVPGLSAANSGMLREIVRYYEIPVCLEARLKAVEGGCVIVETPQGEKRFPADTTVLSVGYTPGTPLAGKERKGVHIVGDAAKVGNLLDVVWKAYDVALKL